jgi:hypothetical protein
MFSLAIVLMHPQSLYALRIGDQVSYPYKIAKIMIIYILVLAFLKTQNY